MISLPWHWQALAWLGRREEAYLQRCMVAPYPFMCVCVCVFVCVSVWECTHTNESMCMCNTHSPCGCRARSKCQSNPPIEPMMLRVLYIGKCATSVTIVVRLDVILLVSFHHVYVFNFLKGNICFTCNVIPVTGRQKFNTMVNVLVHKDDWNHLCSICIHPYIAFWRYVFNTDMVSKSSLCVYACMV